MWDRERQSVIDIATVLPTTFTFSTTISSVENMSRWGNIALQAAAGTCLQTSWGWWTQMGVMLVKQVKNTICPFSCRIFVVRMRNIHLMLQLSSLAQHSAIEWFFHQFRARRTWFIQMEELYSSYDCRWLYSNNNKCPVQAIFSFIIYNHTLSICRVASYPVFSAWSCGIFLLSLTTSSSYRDTKHGMNTVF